MLCRSTSALFALLCCGAAVAQTMDQGPPRVVPSEQLDRYWTMMNSSIEADVPNYAKNIQQPGCATVSFVVGADGRTSDVKVQRVVPEGDLGRVAKSVASGLRFEATPFNAGRQRVFSWLIFPFNLPVEKAAASAVMKQCFIADVPWKDH